MRGMLASSSLNLIIHTWEQDNVQTDIMYSPAIPSSIVKFSWSHDNNYLALLCANGRAEILGTRDKNNVKAVHTINAFEEISSICFQRTTKRFLGVSGYGGEVVIYDTKTRSISKDIANCDVAVKGIDFNSYDSCLAVACENGTIPIYETPNGKLLTTLKLPNTAKPSVLRFHSRDENLLATGSDNGDVVLWNLIGTKKVFFGQSHSSKVTSVSLSTSGHILVSGGVDQKLCIFNLNISECIFRSSVTHPVTATDLHNDGKTLAVGFSNGSIAIYDLRHMLLPVHEIKTHNSEITYLAYANHTEPHQDFDSLLSISEILSQEKNDRDEVHAEPLLIQPTVVNEMLNKFKDDMLKIHYQQISELLTQFNEHIMKLKVFLKGEFEGMNKIIENKFDVDNLVIQDNSDEETSDF